jgi:hypothetical protein
MKPIKAFMGSEHRLDVHVDSKHLVTLFFTKGKKGVLYATLTTKDAQSGTTIPIVEQQELFRVEKGVDDVSN